MAVNVSSPSGSTFIDVFERERLHSLRIGTVISNVCVSLVLPDGSCDTVPVISQQYLSASCSLVTSSDTVTSVDSSASSVTDDSESCGDNVPGSEHPEAELSSSNARLTVACCWPVFSTTRVHSVVSSPPHVLLDVTMDKSTPNKALPDPSPAVLVTVAVSVAGWPGGSGGAGESCAFAVTVVSQEPSAFCASVTFIVASS